MSDISLDPAIFVAMNTLMEAETSRRQALDRLGFRQCAELVMYHETQVANIQLMQRLAEEGMTEEERAALHKVTDKDTEEREELEEEEDVFGRRYILIEAAECLERLRLEARGFELAIRIDEAFKPCVTRVYSYAADTMVYKVLPLPPNALECVDKNPERHLPEFMWTTVRMQAPGYQQLLEHEHDEQFKETVLAIEENPAENQHRKVTIMAA